MRGQGQMLVLNHELHLMHMLTICCLFSTEKRDPARDSSSSSSCVNNWGHTQPGVMHEAAGPGIARLMSIWTCQLTICIHPAAANLR